MKKGSGKDLSGKRGGLGPEDFLLWKEFTRDIAPLHETEDPEAPVYIPQHRPAPGSKVEGIISKTGAPSSIVHPPQLDARTEARLRRGQMPVEGRLDLHGCTQEQAHNRLNKFVTNAYTQGRRCVLVITGKGSRGGDESSIGVLRQKLPLWLSMSPLQEIVLKYYPAVSRDGGAGAWYLYLKRQRDY